MKWIFFDLDDTLWDFTTNSAASLMKLYNVSPILRKLFPGLEEFTEVYHRHNATLWDLYAQGKVSTKELKHERWRRTLATRQFEVLTAVCEELERNYLDILAREREVFPGVKEMLEELTKRMLVGVLSNGFSKTQYNKLHNSGLDKYITRTIVSEEIGVNKPNLELFSYAEKETGATAPIIMVGDHPVTDVLGAMAAGWHAIWFNPRGKEFDIVREMEKRGIRSSLFLGEAETIEEVSRLVLNITI